MKVLKRRSGRPLRRLLAITRLQLSSPLSKQPFAAFTVTLGTLLIQGLTLRPLVLALGVRDDATVEREVRHARIATAEAALAELDDETGGEAEALRAELQRERRIAATGDEGVTRPTSPSKALRAKALAAQRKRLLAIRSDGVIGDEAFHRLEEELDFSELAVTK
jgi:monovalent cation/hydrogen antiporter